MSTEKDITAGLTGLADCAFNSGLSTKIPSKQTTAKTD
jgi:hypothetical protein